MAAYHVARGSIAWAPVEHEPSRAAALEVGYWKVHRDLVGNPDKSAVVTAMAELHAELFAPPADRKHALRERYRSIDRELNRSR